MQLVNREANIRPVWFSLLIPPICCTTLPLTESWRRKGSQGSATSTSFMQDFFHNLAKSLSCLCLNISNVREFTTLPRQSFTFGTGSTHHRHAAHTPGWRDAGGMNCISVHDRHLSHSYSVCWASGSSFHVRTSPFSCYDFESLWQCPDCLLFWAVWW